MIKREQTDTVCTVYLDRPDQRNAMNSELVGQLTRLIRAINHEKQVGALVLAGTGKGFCAGSDLAALAQMTPAERVQFEAESGLLARMIGQCEKPVIAAVHGFAVGGGLTLAVACDIVITQAAAKWSMPEVPIGLFPAWGIGSIVDRIGVPAARRLCWGIDTLSGTQAVACGLADVVADDPMSEARAIAGRLAALPRAQAGGVKRFFGDLALHERMDVAANRMFLESTLSPEAIDSFAHFGNR